MKKAELIDAYSKTGKIVPIKTKKVLRKVPFKKSKRVLGVKILYFSLYFIPLFLCLFIVSRNSNELLKEWMSVVLLIGTVLSVWIAYLGFMMIMLNKKVKTGRVYKRWFKIFAAFILSVYVLGGVGFTTLLYGPYKGFREWLITTAMTTMSHQYYATWFYSEDAINKVFAENYIIEIAEDSNPDLIQIVKYEGGRKIYANKFEEEVLNRTENKDYKIIDIKTNKYHGKLIAVYEPSKVILGVGKNTGTSFSQLKTAHGEKIETHSKNYNAQVAINAGGFYDPDWRSSGGVPHGIVFSQGELKSNTPKAPVGGGLVGFNREDKLILGRMSVQQAKEIGIRDAVDFGPFLIVNGKSSFIRGNAGWGTAPRTAIGQRKDGIVLFLVINGRQTGSLGASMGDLTGIMEDYGAVNAAAMDGGTSTVMTENHVLINKPMVDLNRPGSRRIPNVWLLLP